MTIRREEGFVSLSLKDKSHIFLVPRFDIQRKPRQIFHGRHRHNGRCVGRCSSNLNDAPLSCVQNGCLDKDFFSHTLHLTGRETTFTVSQKADFWSTFLTLTSLTGQY